MKRIITISREYGSGGQVIGHLVAKELGYNFYDKELIDLAAQESGLSPDFIEKNEQNLSSAWLYNLLVGTSYAGVSTGTSGHTLATHTPVLPLADQVFNAQRKSILAIAKKSSCVIVGRCADYILSTSDEIDPIPSGLFFIAISLIVFIVFILIIFIESLQKTKINFSLIKQLVTKELKRNS